MESPILVICINRQGSIGLNEHPVKKIIINIAILFISGSWFKYPDNNKIKQQNIKNYLERHKHGKEICQSEERIFIDLSSRDVSRKNKMIDILEEQSDNINNLHTYLFALFKSVPHVIPSILKEILNKRLSFNKEDQNYTEYVEIEEIMDKFLNETILGYDTTKGKEDMFMYNTESGNEINIILDIKENFNIFDEDGKNVLHFTSNHRPPCFIKILTKYCEKEDINRKCEIMGKYPLHFLFENSSVDEDTIRLFIEKGAELNAIFDEPITMYKSFSNPNLKNNKTPLMNLLFLNSCEENCKKDLVKVLLDAGALINIEGVTHLHMAILINSLKIVKMLLDHNANINLKNQIGLTPLHHAVTKNCICKMKLLLDYGGDTNIKNQKNETPLNFSISYGRTSTFEIQKLLLDYGADINEHNTAFSSIDEIYETEFIKILGKHLIKQKCYNKNKYLTGFEWTLDKMEKEEKETIYQEIELLKKCLVDLTNISLFDILCTKDIFKYSRSQELVDEIESEKFKEDITNYTKFSNTLKIKCKEIIIYNKIYNLILHYTNLPTVCVDNIFKFLKKNDVMRLYNLLYGYDIVRFDCCSGPVIIR